MGVILVILPVSALLLGLFYKFYVVREAIAGGEYQPDEDFLVSRLRSGEYEIDSNQLSPQEILTIHYSTQPDDFSENRKSIEAIPPKTTIKGLSPKVRFYFFIQSTDQSPGRILSERQIKLDGAGNFRDLGGYQNKDGLYVKWGKIYRSDKLSSLSSRDYRYLKMLQIHTIYDFRGPEEIKAHPTRFPDFFQPKLNPLPIYDPRRTMRDLLKLLRTSNPQTFSGETYMIEGYQMFTEQFIGQYKLLFDELLMNDEGSVLYHCTGGKDRTGLATALILFLLDVPWETIYQDYLTSNYYRLAENKRHIRLGRLYGIAPAILIPILEVRKIYLDTALQTILESYGTLENFMQEKLGIGVQEKNLLKEKYLYIK